MRDWRNLGVEGHFAARRPWLTYAERLAPALARLIGAGPQEVAVMNTLTVNLHLLLVSFYRPAGERTALLIERRAFPSDRYAAESQVRLTGSIPARDLIELGAAWTARTACAPTTSWPRSSATGRGSRRCCSLASST